MTSVVKKTESEQEKSPLFPLVPTSKLTQVQDAAGLLEEDVNAAGFKGYVSRVFTQVSLPYKDPLRGDSTLRWWERRNGAMKLRVEPALIDTASGETCYQFPFGKYPRLILPWLSTMVVRVDRLGQRSADGSITITLPSSTRAFFRDLGLRSTGKGGRDFTAQLQRLFGARFTVAETVSNKVGVGIQNASFQVADAFQLWFSKDSGELAQGGLWDSEVVVSKRFVDNLLGSPIPIDLRALSVLAKSGPLAMDMYSWLNYRLPAAKIVTDQIQAISYDSESDSTMISFLVATGDTNVEVNWQFAGDLRDRYTAGSEITFSFNVVETFVQGNNYFESLDFFESAYASSSTGQLPVIDDYLG